MNDDATDYQVPVGYQPLVRGIDASGHRYFLNGLPVYNGDVLDMQERGPCRFEWSCSPGVPPQLVMVGTEPFELPHGARFLWLLPMHGISE